MVHSKRIIKTVFGILVLALFFSLRSRFFIVVVCLLRSILVCQLSVIKKVKSISIVFSTQNVLHKLWSCVCVCVSLVWRVVCFICGIDILIFVGDVESKSFVSRQFDMWKGAAKMKHTHTHNVLCGFEKGHTTKSWESNCVHVMSCWLDCSALRSFFSGGRKLIVLF